MAGIGLIAPGIGVIGLRNGYCAQAQSLFAAMSVQPTWRRKRSIDRVIRGLASHGIWAKLDALWIMAAHDVQAARLNWVAPGSNTLSDVGSPTFTADLGFTGNGSSSALSTGYNPGGGGSPKYIRDSSCLFGWSLTAGQTTAFDANKSMMGVAGGTSDAFIFPRDTSDVFRTRVNALSSTSLGNNIGNSFYVSTRTGSAATAVYQYTTARIQTNTSTAASQAVKNATWRLLGTDGGFWPGSMAVAGAGSALTGAEADILFCFLRDYLDTIGTV